jgi:hypothetical protein
MPAPTAPRAASALRRFLRNVFTVLVAFILALIFVSSGLYDWILVALGWREPL